MPLLLRPSRFAPVSKPIHPVIDRAHPLAQGLVGAYFLAEGGGFSAVNAAGPIVGTLGANATRIVSPHGPAVTLGGAANGVDFGTAPGPFTLTSNFSWVVRVYPTTTSGLRTPLLWATGYFISLDSGDYTLGRTGVAHDVRATGAVTANTWQDFGVTVDSAVGVVIYKNGLAIAIGSTTSTAPSGNFSASASSFPLNGESIAHIFIYNRRLVGSEMRDLWANPLAMVLRPRREWAEPVVAAAGQPTMARWNGTPGMALGAPRFGRGW